MNHQEKEGLFSRSRFFLCWTDVFCSVLSCSTQIQAVLFRLTFTFQPTVSSPFVYMSERKYQVRTYSKWNIRSTCMFLPAPICTLIPILLHVLVRLCLMPNGLSAPDYLFWLGNWHTGNENRLPKCISLRYPVLSWVCVFSCAHKA